MGTKQPTPNDSYKNFHIANISETKVRKVKKNAFLPKISQGRRLMLLDEEQVPSALNPYRVEPTTERVLALGERTREVDKLDSQKYKLIQRIADNAEYIDNLASKRLNH